MCVPNFRFAWFFVWSEAVTLSFQLLPFKIEINLRQDNRTVKNLLTILNKSHQIYLLKNYISGFNFFKSRQRPAARDIHSFTRIYVCWSVSGFMSCSHGRNRGASLQRFWMPKTDIFEGNFTGSLFVAKLSLFDFMLNS